MNEHQVGSADRVRLVSYGSRAPGKIFVAVPNERGRYVLTDRCVAFVSCPLCQSTMGEPCKGSKGQYIGSTHWMRRTASRMGRRALDNEPPPDIVKEQDVVDADKNPEELEWNPGVQP